MSEPRTGIADLIDPATARGALRGLERETLRVTPTGRIARSPHPPALGSALAHPAITTDYSEALLEFVTAPHPDSAAVLGELMELEAYTAGAIGEELLWMTSMPCFIDDPATIPIARYGGSNAGRMKHLYRVGLANRYGAAMQAIAGVHFNFSFPDPLWSELLRARRRPAGRGGRDAAWMGLVRNVERHGWVLLYLYGASPAVCPSFSSDPPSWLQRLGNGSLAAPYGTSLRLSDIGYKNRSQAYLSVSTNSLEEWISDLSRALFTEDPDYAAMGVRKGDEWRQLSAGILQIDNEYYGLVRPKSRPRTGERPAAALAREGVRYVELRALDVDPDTPLGIAPEAMAFLELFMWFCLLEPSPPLAANDRLEISYNQRNVAVRGREPGLRLRRAGGYQSLADWGRELVDALAPIAEFLDAGLAERPHGEALAHAAARFDDPGRTPSARVLEAIDATPEGYLAWGIAVSRRHTEALRARVLDAAIRERLEAAARDSLSRQAQIEAGDDEPFEAYLERYYASGPRA